MNHGCGTDSIVGEVAVMRGDTVSVLVVTIATGGIGRVLPETETIVGLAEALLAGPVDE